MGNVLRFYKHFGQDKDKNENEELQDKDKKKNEEVQEDPTKDVQ